MALGSGGKTNDGFTILRQTNRAANAFSDEVAGIEAKFGLPRNRSQQHLPGTARSFAADAGPHEAKFIEYGLPAAFVSYLQKRH